MHIKRFDPLNKDCQALVIKKEENTLKSHQKQLRDSKQLLTEKKLEMEKKQKQVI
jgi:hypothetical protein